MCIQVIPKNATVIRAPSVATTHTGKSMVHIAKCLWASSTKFALGNKKLFVYTTCQTVPFCGATSHLISSIQC
jgi:hypothetical protein